MKIIYAESRLPRKMQRPLDRLNGDRQLTMSAYLRLFFFGFVVRPLVYVILGLNVRHWERLPGDGPAVIVANHNSHLDTLVLMSLLPLRMLKKLHPVADADYFLRNRLLAWFATQIIGIIPLTRSGASPNPLSGCFQALRDGNILILFPEGSRGTPESRMAEFKRGVQIIARKFPDVPVYPIFLHGLGKALPKGEALLVPFFCDVFVGAPMTYRTEQENFMDALRSEMNVLAAQGEFPEWQ